MNRERFASKMLILARECAELHNINPIIAASQACLETGYGKSILSKKANNLFGIQANDNWKGLKYPMKSREFLSMRGLIVKKIFYRSYATWSDCFNDYFVEIGDCLLYDTQTVNYKVKPMLFLERIQPKEDKEYGCVSDPRYREKILSIAKKWKWI